MKRKECRRKRRKNQERRNLTKQENRGLTKLLKTIQNKEILVLKTYKSGNLTLISREKYLELGGKKENAVDKKIYTDCSIPGLRVYMNWMN